MSRGFSAENLLLAVVLFILGVMLFLIFQQAYDRYKHQSREAHTVQNLDQKIFESCEEKNGSSHCTYHTSYYVKINGVWHDTNWKTFKELTFGGCFLFDVYGSKTPKLFTNPKLLNGC